MFPGLYFLAKEFAFTNSNLYRYITGADLNALVAAAIEMAEENAISFVDLGGGSTS
jgi:hypothetical protein